jgi:hypothetical protein
LTQGKKTERKRTELSGVTFVFHIFMRNQKRIQKHRKQIWKWILSETDMERIRREHGQKTDDYRNQKTTWIMQQNSSKSSKSKNLFPKPIKITQCNGGVGVDCFNSSIWQDHVSAC